MKNKANYYALLISILTEIPVNEAIRLMGLKSHRTYNRKQKRSSKELQNKPITSI